MKPYYVSNVVAGFKDGNRYLGSVDPHGTYLENDFILTGFASMFCKPLI